MQACCDSSKDGFVPNSAIAFSHGVRSQPEQCCDALQISTGASIEVRSFEVLSLFLSAQRNRLATKPRVGPDRAKGGY